MTNKILIVGPAWVGDMVMAQSLFKLLKQQYPTASIDVLAPAWSLPLLARMEEVSRSIPITIGHGVVNLPERYRLASTLRSHHYDQAIVLPNSFKSALVPYLARIPLRTGWRGEWRYGLLNDLRVLNKTSYPLMVERFVALGLKPNAPLPDKQAYAPSLLSTKELQDAALARHGMTLSGKPIIALCPGAEFGPSKRWPEAYYADVAKQKIQEGFDVFLLGSAKDRAVTDVIMTLTDHACFNLAGETRLEEVIDFLSLANIVVSNDSGLMHIAAALQKPLVAIYGSTSAAFTPPLSIRSRIVSLALDCQPCFERICPLKHHRCMRDLTPGVVLAELDNLLK